MKKIILLILSAICLSFIASTTSTLCFAQQNGFIRCATMQNDSILRANNPTMGALEDMEEMLAPIIKRKREINPNANIIDGVYIIPIIVHVVHNGEAIGTGNNISYARILSQIESLNDDFRRRVGTNGFNNHPDGADTRIEFRLAQRKPDGTAFTEIGVNRINRNTVGWAAPPYSATYINANIKPYTTTTQGYDGTAYMSFWCVPITGGTLGYAQFPQTTLGGMNCNPTNTVTDGVVMTTGSVGGQTTPATSAPYDLGRTATHEIGHWLGLRHIWGDGGCNVDDFCADTPLAGGSNGGCPIGTNSCALSPPDMIENYMDYTNDACMNIFTNDQKIRMRTILETTRFSLINSVASIPPNPSDAGVLNVIAPMGDICNGTITPLIRIKNYGSTTLTSVTVESRISIAGAYTSQAFTGLSIPAGGTANFILNPITGITNGTYTFEARTILPNGVTDPFTDSDLSNSTFTLGSGVLPILADFEGADFPPPSWQRLNPGNDCNLWTIDNSLNLVGSNGNLTKAALVRHISYTGTGQEDILISPSIDLTDVNLTEAKIDFDLAYRQRNATTSETLRIDVSTDCGATWTAAPIYTKTGTALTTVATTSTTAFIPTAANQWRRESVSLNTYLGQSIKVRFVTTNANGNNLWIDNVRIYDARPAIQYSVIDTTITENSTSGTIDCRGYQDITIPVSIDRSAASTVTVNVTATGGTMNAQDYTLQTPTITFPANTITSQNVVVRVFNDNALEVTETLQLTLSVIGTTAILGTNTVHTLIVNDNDDLTQTITQTLFSENFETYTAGAVSGGWTVTDATAGNNKWVFGENGGMTGTRSAYITQNVITRSLTYNINTTTATRLVSPAISTVGATNLQLSFDFKVEGESYTGSGNVYDYGRLMYSTSPTGPYTNITGPADNTSTGTTTNANPFFAKPNSTAYAVTLPIACQNQATLYLVWRWDNDNSVGANPPFTVDNIVLSASTLQEYAVENTLTSKQVYLGANSTVYVVSSNNKVMAKLENNTAHDYGCTTVAIDRVGTGTVAYTSVGAVNELTQKSFRITPTNISTQNIGVTLYYTNAEKTGWEVATGLSWTTDAKMHRTGGTISAITPTTPMVNGATNSEHALTNSAYLTTEHAAKATITNGFGNGNASGGFAIGDPRECDITAITYVNQTACVSATNKYTADVTITYINPSGNLIVNGQTFTTTTSPQLVTLTDLESDGNTVDITASFSGNVACTFTSTAAFTAPANCAFTGTVTLGIVAPTIYCAGTSISIPYTTSGTFGTTNEFTAQLSDEAGSFATPITIASGTSPISLAIPSNGTASTSYKIRVISTEPSSISAEATITINTAPTVTFILPTSSQNRCSTDVLFALSGGSPAGGTYSGTGVTTGNFDPVAAGVGTHLITYSVTVGGCTSTATQTITVSTAPIATFTTPPNACSTATAFTLTGGSPTGGVYSGANVNSVTGTFNATTAGIGTHTVTYTTILGTCTSSATATITVISCPTGGGTPTPTVTTPTGFTATGVSTSQINLSWAAVSGATDYILYIGNTVLATIPSGTTTFQHTGLNADTFYLYRLVATTGAIQSQYVQANGATSPNAPTIFSTTASCGTGSATIVLGGSGSIFNIYLEQTGGTAIEQTINAIYLTPLISQNTVYYISVIGQQGRESTRTRIEAVVIPPIEASISQGTSLRSCDATTTLTANEVTSATYTWLINGIAIDNSNSSSFVASRSGNYQVRITQANCSTTSAFSRVMLNYAPSAEITNGSTANFCTNGTLRARETANATYSWTLNNAVVGIEREVSVSQSGEYTLTVTEDDCSATDIIQVVVTFLPSVSVETSSPTFCPEEEVTLTTEQINGVTYAWSRNGRVIRRDAGNSIIATSGGEYSVTISQNGCSVSSSNINVERLSVEPAYLRTSETTLFVESESTISTIVWTVEGTDDTSLEGQTTVTPTESASYSALVTYESGCSIRTRTVRFNVPPPVVTGQEKDFSKALRIYPNPSTNGVFQIELGNNAQNVAITLVLTDQLGRVLQTTVLPLDANSYQLDLSNYASSLYTLQFKSENDVITRKIVIEK